MKTAGKEVRNSSSRINEEESRGRSESHYFGRRREKSVTLLEVFHTSEYYEMEDIRMVGIGTIREGEWKFCLLVNGGIHILKM